MHRCDSFVIIGKGENEFPGKHKWDSGKEQDIFVHLYIQRIHV